MLTSTSTVVAFHLYSRPTTSHLLRIEQTSSRARPRLHRCYFVPHSEGKGHRNEPELNGSEIQPISIDSFSSRNKILVVEDEGIVALDLTTILRQRGYIVTATAASGEEAIQQVMEIQPDLVLMDIRLEGDMDGIETAQYLRRRFELPVIFLTAFADEDTLRRAQMIKPAGFLRKPFARLDLYDAIESALRQT